MKAQSVFSLPKLWLLALGLLLSPLMGWPATRSSDLDELPARLALEVNRTMLSGNIPSATVALVRGDKIIWSGAFGYANIWAKTSAFPNTVYLIGSTFKPMSTFALLQQMELGKFNLDDAVNKYLSEFKIQGDNPSNPVTFRHLLTHTSGLPADFGPYSIWADHSPLPLRIYLERSLKLQNPPLTHVVYSNLAYTLLAYLVEKFSGVPYKQYIQKNIFEPLEMKDTGFEPRPDMVERLAIPYYFEPKSDRYIPVTWLKANVWPAGIVYGSVTDQAQWLIANLNQGVYKGHRLISEETFKEVMTKQYAQFSGPVSEGWLNKTTGYGLTWWISEQNGEKIFAHSGSVSGYTAFVAGNLDEKTGFVILTNGNKSHKYLFDLAIKVLDILAAEIKAEEARQGK